VAVTRGERNCLWIEKYCRIPEGSKVGQPVVLSGFQRDDIKRIYDNPHGTRRAILSFARKNGKTAIAAFLLLLHLCGPEAKANSSLYSAAQSRDQAAILYTLAAKCVRLSPNLKSFVTPRDTKKELVCPELGTLYRALAAEASTTFGLSPAFIVHDELGQVKGPRSALYEALETATAAQASPLSIVISTQAPTDADLLSVLIDDATSGADPRVVLSLYTAPPEDDPFDEKTIRKANPAFDDFQNQTEILAMAEDARRMPSRENEYRNLVLNQRVTVSSPFVSRSVWKDNGAVVPRKFGRGKVYGGLDLSEVNDLTALVLVEPSTDVWQVQSTFWLPGHELGLRAEKDRVPYDTWKSQGFLDTTPGKTIEYSFISQRLRIVCDSYDVGKINFDAWNWRHLRPWLLKEDQSGKQLFTEEEVDRYFEEFGQGFRSMSPALRDTESLLLNHKLAHGNHPVLTMCAGNAVVKGDEAGNRKLTKTKSYGRIDGMVSLVMAVAAAATYEVPEAAPTSPWDDPEFTLAG